MSDESSVTIGNVQGGITNSNIVGHDLNQVAESASAADIQKILEEVRQAITALQPRLETELGQANPAAPHLGTATKTTLDAAAKKIEPSMNKEQAKEVHTQLDQAKSMLETIIKGAQTMPGEVTKASSSVGDLINSISGLASKIAIAVQWSSKLIG